MRDRLLFCQTCSVRFLQTAGAQRRADLAGESSTPRYCPGCLALSKLRDRKRGTLRWYNNRRGYGFVRGEQGDVFLHASSLPAEKPKLRTGQTMEYRLTQTDRGPAASDVEIVTDVGQ